MRKLANHVTLFGSHDNTGYLVKYTDPKLIQSKDWINIDYFMVDECVRFLFTSSCERSL